LGNKYSSDVNLEHNNDLTKLINVLHETGSAGSEKVAGLIWSCAVDIKVLNRKKI